ncbi:DUF427 domain-containing protein [Rubrobacter calidifluminis]|uniref:DUF427 domain-containing protein n=1 Tax=Rubrobacter calidifluminis TaxID=1392640 RepID=UPI00235EED8A|nr:DUF427 domain-containing protein [Rubrobacter calidifluminis]
MSLTMGTGPFGPKRSGEFNFDTSILKPHTLYFEDCPKRVRTFFGGETVADSRRVKVLHETGLLPVYYFPEEDVRTDLLEKTDHRTRCPFKGEAVYFSVRAGGRLAENAVWSYPEPLEDAPPLSGYLAFYHDRMDRWMEEEEETIGHPHDPYHRVDVLQSSLHVRVSVGGEVVAETRRPLVLFETSLPPRYYIPPEDVREDLLVPSDTHTVCPYKGVASYRSLKVGDTLVEDAAWLYPDPLPEAQKARGYLCFYEEKVEQEVEG